MTPSLGTTTAPGEFLAPFVPSPEALVDLMLEVARVGPGDTVYDLGAGDGRIVVAAAQRFGARAVGVELDNNRFAFASSRIRDFGLEPRARMVHGDLLAIDLTPATVVTLYQLPSVNEMLRPALERQLRSGARVVALDFPVQGWKPSNVLAARLTDGSQHAIYLYSIDEIRKDAATMATRTDGIYDPATCWLELQGAPAAFLQSAEGGDATADVLTPDYTTQDFNSGRWFVRKDFASGVKYEDITISFGPAVSSSLSDWISAILQGSDRPVNGAVLMGDYKGNVASRLNFYNGRISEIGFPALDAGSNDSAYITLKITPEHTTRAAADSGGNVAAIPAARSGAVQKPWLAKNFALKIDGQDCSGVNGVDELTITRRSVSVGQGQGRWILEIPNLAVTLSQVGSEMFRNWHEDSVIKGQHSAKNGDLVYLDSDLKTVLFTLKFGPYGLRIFRLTPEKWAGGNVPRLRAELCCDVIEFHGGAVPTPATEGAPSPTQQSFSGTRNIAPAYVQPFPTGATVNWKQAAQPFATVGDVFQSKIAPDATVKLTKGAPVPDEVAAPLRLGRPLRFRS